MTEDEYRRFYDRYDRGLKKVHDTHVFYDVWNPSAEIAELVKKQMEEAQRMSEILYNGQHSTFIPID